MGECIDLISSSPAPLSPPRAAGSPKPLPNDGYSPLAKAVPALKSNDLTYKFEFTGMSSDLDFPEPRLPKRRRVSPRLSPPKSERFSLQGTAEEPIGLSDDDGLPMLSVLRESPSGGRYLAGSSRSKFGSLDAIEFTSSAPEPRRVKGRVVDIMDLSDEFDLPENDFETKLPSSSQPAPNTKSRDAFSARTANLLANISNQCGKRPSETNNVRTVNSFRTKTIKPPVVKEADDIDYILSPSPLRSLQAEPGRSSKLSEVEREARKAEKLALKMAKDAGKEAEKERKRLDKERRAQEKQRAADIAEVNKSKTDKKNSIHEMMVDMASGFKGTSIGNQVEEFMKRLEVDTLYLDEDVDLSGDNGSEVAGNVIRWRRKVDGDYDAELDHFTPLGQSRIDREEHIIIHLTGVEFCALASRQADGVCAHLPEAAMKHNIDNHVHAVQRKYKDSKPIYLLESLTAFLKKNKNAKNREYQAAARAADVHIDSSSAPSASQNPHRGKKSKAATQDLSFFTPDITDALLLHIQLTHPTILIHHTLNAISSAQWIKTFTETLSTRPYRLLKNAFNDTHAGFCMDTGQVKTGENVEDTYIRMLQELPRVTSSMAHGIRDSGFGNVRELVDGYKSEGRLMLQDVRKAMNRDGGVSERRLGPQVSKRLYKVFFGQDPESMDV